MHLKLTPCSHIGRYRNSKLLQSSLGERTREHRLMLQSRWQLIHSSARSLLCGCPLWLLLVLLLLLLLLLRLLLLLLL